MVITCGIPNYNIVQFEWFLTNWCNYSCTYCSEVTRLIPQFSKATSPGKYKLVLSRLKSVQHQFVIELIGGEPTLHPAIEEILTELNNMPNCKEVQLITNLSRPLHFYQTLTGLALNKLAILSSFHPEHYKPEWLDKVLALKTNSLSVTLNLSDQPEHWPLTLDTINSLIDHDVVFAYNILSATPKWTPNYTQEFYDTFNPYINNGKHNESVPYTFEDGTTRILHESEIIEKGLHRLTGYKCTPIRYRITHDSDIQNFCTGRKLPLMLTPAEIFKQEVCPNACCGCDAVFKFHKEKI